MVEAKRSSRSSAPPPPLYIASPRSQALQTVMLQKREPTDLKHHSVGRQGYTQMKILGPFSGVAELAWLSLLLAVCSLSFDSFRARSAEG